MLFWKYRPSFRLPFLLYTLCILAACLFPPRLSAQTIPLKKEYATTLVALSDALLKRQMVNATDTNYGGIWCEHCNVWHTRAAEAVYPFTISYFITKQPRYLSAARMAASWLISQQQPDGSWKETPEEWTGTTTDQLLMLLLAYEKVAPLLEEKERVNWQGAMQKAADYLEKVMRPEFASINYVATTTATLAKAGTVLKKSSYTATARRLARRVISKMDEDGFLNGEGGKSHGNKMGVDLGYNMEMSLWGLGLYAKISSDTIVNDKVKHALSNHLYFIYPDGSLDASWGIRSNKWTAYGSATSDGCQVLFSLFADEDPRYATASFRNLQFLRKNFTGDLLGYGPQYASLFTRPPCIYPSFAKAKNLAMAYEFETKEDRVLKPIPADEEGWAKEFRTLDLVLVRTKNFMATITSYRYKDQAAGSKGKYMFRPDGGAISHLWAKGHGFLQASSATIYTRPEPMSFPEAPGILSLTPRIEYTDTAGYFTNLFEFDSRIQLIREKDSYRVKVAGELKDKNWLTGGVGYRMEYLFTDTSVQKTIELIYHDAWPTVQLIEPFVLDQEMSVSQTGEHTAILSAGGKRWSFSLLEGQARLLTGKDASRYWAPYPSFKAYPLVWELAAGKPDQPTKITYRLTMLN